MKDPSLTLRAVESYRQSVDEMHRLGKTADLNSAKKNVWMHWKDPNPHEAKYVGVMT